MTVSDWYFPDSVNWSIDWHCSNLIFFRKTKKKLKALKEKQTMVLINILLCVRICFSITFFSFYSILKLLMTYTWIWHQRPFIQYSIWYVVFLQHNNKNRALSLLKFIRNTWICIIYHRESAHILFIPSLTGLAQR